MSRIGKKPIIIPAKVEVFLSSEIIKVKGPLGELEKQIHPAIVVEKEGEQLLVKLKNEGVRKDWSLWGLFRTLINNMILGVSQGFEKKLEIIGIGYKVAQKGNDLVLNLGFSHPVDFKAPLGIKTEVSGNIITVKGIDKAQVGEITAQIRKLRPPEPYKGKGIKYVGEIIRRKAGKVAKGSEK